MKRFFAAVVVVFSVGLFGVADAQAGMPIKQAGNLGIGFGVGTTAVPISVKYFLSGTSSIQGNIGWWRGPWAGRFCDDFGRYCRGYSNSLGLSGDYLLEGGPLVGNSEISLDWQAGGGVGIGVSEFDFGLAVSGNVGLQVNIHAIPIDFVVEYRPGFYIVPDFFFDWWNFTGHIRYYF
jgi:hypothetical protein